MRNRAVAIFAVSLAVGASGCARTVQVWPPPLEPGSTVRVRFAAPRVVVFSRGAARDSVAGVKELRGIVSSLHGDTLALRVTSDQEHGVGQSRSVERQTTLALDQGTSVTSTQVDGWKLAYGVLAGAVLIFAGLVMSGS